MAGLRHCPRCGSKIELGYACGEHFIMSDTDDCPVCGIEAFTEMHSNENAEIEAWNKRGEYAESMVCSN